MRQTCGRAGRDHARAGLTIAGVAIIHVQGKTGATGFADCNGADIVIANVDLPDMQGCLVLTPQILRDTGALALDVDNGGIVITTANGISGQRLWSPEPPVAVSLTDPAQGRFAPSADR